MRKLISIIIPTYNEEKVISDCLKSLNHQIYKNFEIILIDDGSTDSTLQIIENLKHEMPNIHIFKQGHQGPGVARNLGSKYAKGEILIFVDADMTFEKNFIKDLTIPILRGDTIGTFSKSEMVKNKNNIWSICWSLNKNLPLGSMIPKDYPNESPVFRAILKKKFKEVNGFDLDGDYADDWSLSQKLKIKSTLAQGALYYHSNPSTLKEVWQQARWIGKNKFISGKLTKRITSAVQYSLPVSLLIGAIKSLVKRQPVFIIFKIWYDLAVWISVLKSFLGEPKSK